MEKPTEKSVEVAVTELTADVLNALHKHLVAHGSRHADSIVKTIVKLLEVHRHDATCAMLEEIAILQALNKAPTDGGTH